MTGLWWASVAGRRPVDERGAGAAAVPHHARRDERPALAPGPTCTDAAADRAGGALELRETPPSVSPAQATSRGGPAEPAGEVVVQVLLIVADPGDVAVGAEQDARNIQCRSGIREVVDPVRPAADGQAFGAVQQQAAAAMQQTVEVALFHVDVAQAAAEQVGACAEVVADADRGDLLDQIAVHLVEVHQFGEQPAHGLRARFGGRQFHLGAGVVQHVLGDRMTFGLVGVQQCFRRPAADLCGQFPAEVEGVLNAQVEALSADGWMDVRRIAGQQHPPDPITFGQPGGIPEAGQPARGVHAEIGSGDGAQLLFEILEGGRFRAVADSRGGDDDADRPLRRRAGARIA